MDRKSIAILVATFIVLVMWYPMMNRIYPPSPVVETNAVGKIVGGTNRDAVIFASTNVTPSVATQSIAPVSAPTPKPIIERSDVPEEIVQIENDRARYFFTTHGGGLKLVELKQYPAVVVRRTARSLTTNSLATLNTGAPRAIFSLVGAESLQGDGIYKLTKTTNGLRAEKSLTNGFSVIKDFRLSTNYLIDTTVRIENASSQKLPLPEQNWILGASTPIGPRDNNPLMLGAMEYNGTKSEVINDAWFANRTLGCIPGTPRVEYRSPNGVVWGAVYNQFFALAIMANPKESPVEMGVKRLDLPKPSLEEMRADPKLVANPMGFEATMHYGYSSLEPKQSVERHYTIYAGPKEYNGLARIGEAYGNSLDLIMNFGVFGIVAKLLLLSMNGLHALHLGYGAAIVLITVIIKLVLWPLTTASTRSMKRMSALQPQMKALQEKYKDDPKKMNLKLMEFMKENKVSPLNGCFPMLLQIPVFMGFYTMLQSAIELRGASFLWAKDLSAPDTIFHLAGFPVNPLPLFMGVTMLWQAHMTPPSPGMDPMQQKIMKYMPLMFMVFLYNFSAGLTLYWTVQNLLSIAQMKLTKTEDPLAVAPVRRHGGSAPGAFGGRKK